MSELTIREAIIEDLPALVALLADDDLGKSREETGDPLPAEYVAAFRAIAADPNIVLLVGTLDGRIVATLQLTFTPHLSYRGGWRATVESVRTQAELRSRGIGAQLMRHATELARARNCVLVQLTTHRSRTRAHQFYERLGFVTQHVGMKLFLR